VARPHPGQDGREHEPEQFQHGLKDRRFLPT
jgi:hypothetical protein